MPQRWRAGVMKRPIAWLGWVLASILCATSGCAVAEVRARQLSDRIRADIRAGQPVSQVLRIAEEALANQGAMALPYFMTFVCEDDRLWSLMRRTRGEGSLPFIVLGPSDRRQVTVATEQVLKRLLTLDEALVLVDHE